MKQSLRSAALSFTAVILLFAAACAAAQVWNIRYSEREAEQVYEPAQQHFLTPADDDSLPSVNWQELRLQYPEIEGWLYCPGTSLNYPVVQGSDNSFYLTHLANGDANKHGAVFIDYRNYSPFADDNTVIYGHNMNDKTMFHGLLNWGNANYASEHPVMYLFTPQQDYLLRLFNACVVASDTEAYRMTFNTHAEKNEWLNRMAQLSYFTADYVPNAELPIVTFSTCSGRDHWFVIQAAVSILNKGEK